VAHTGDAAAGEKAAVALFEHRYENGYGAHAPMEPHAALADVKAGQATAWISTQAPFPNNQQLARELGIEFQNVRVITPFVGGAFGGKSGSALQAVHAARLSQAVGRPVQVAWTRAEEFFHDAFRPAGVVTIKSGIDAAGKIVLWEYGVYAAGSRSTEQFYDVPNSRVRTYGNWYGGSGTHPFAVGPWRAPGANLNVFARESQVDIMAAAAKADPLEFRLRNTSDARMRSVLQAAAERFGWTAAAGPSGRGHGIACGIDAGTYVGMCAQVEVDKASGKVRVKRIVCAQDMGQVINPEGAKMQMEGCVAMGLGYALSETLRFSGGTVLDRNFDTYELPRFSGMPAIEAVLVANDALTPQGGGEPAIVAVGAAIANAIFDATGARMWRMPMTAERVRGA
jgi:isoquinoline 1-oxidoreductase